MIKTPLRYPGGKSRSVDLLLQYVPKFSEYREPFIGGGSLFIALKGLYPKKKFWINDLYKELYYFYRWCKLKPQDVIDNVKELKSKCGNDGKTMFFDIKERINSKKVPQKVIAAMFFVINRVSFSGTTMSGGFSQSAFEKRFTNSSIDRLFEFSKILKKNVRITNFDYEKVISKDGRNVFIYLDPPYAIKNESLYGKNGDLHKNFDHERFAKALKECKHKWMITYNDCDYIRNLFSWATIIPFEASYGMKNVRKDKENIVQKGKEIIIKNF